MGQDCALQGGHGADHVDQALLGSAPGTHPLTELDLTLMDVENGFDAQQVSKAGDKLIDTTAAAQIVEIIDDGQ